MAKTATHASRAGWAGLDPPGTPMAPHRHEILQVIRLYIDGFGSHDAEMFTEAFHPAARIYCQLRDGRLWEDLISDWFQEWAGDKKGPAKARILQLTQAGDVALVLLGFDGGVHDPDPYWVDVHTLLRTSGTWKIMAKTATHASRADWAGVG